MWSAVVVIAKVLLVTGAVADGRVPRRWRVVAEDLVHPPYWDVRHLEFLSGTGDTLPVTSVFSSGVPDNSDGWFDSAPVCDVNPRPDWTCWGGRPDSQGTYWIGAELPADAPDVSAVRLVHMYTYHFARMLRLEYANPTGAWIVAGKYVILDPTPDAMDVLLKVDNDHKTPSEASADIAPETGPGAGDTSMCAGRHLPPNNRIGDIVRQISFVSETQPLLPQPAVARSTNHTRLTDVICRRPHPAVAVAGTLITVAILSMACRTVIDRLFS